MPYSPEVHHPEVSSVGHILKKAGAWAVAGVIAAGGATGAIAYNDLRQGVDAPVFDIHHAETHALELGQNYANTDPANVMLDAPLITVELS